MSLAGIYRCTSVFQLLRSSKFSPNFLIEKCVRNVQTPKAISVHIKYFCIDKPPPTVAGKPSADPFAKPKTRKPLKSPEITLISADDVVTSVTLEDAEKLAKRRNLKLVKIIDFDTKTERPTYKLMTVQQFFQEEAKTKEKKKKERDSTYKDDKLFQMSSKIGENDLYNKIKQMHRALKRKHIVRVYISHDGNPTRANEISEIIDEELNDLISKKDQATKLLGTIKLHLTPKLDSENRNTVDIDEDKESTKKKKKLNKESVKS